MAHSGQELHATDPKSALTCSDQADCTSDPLVTGALGEILVQFLEVSDCIIKVF
jgi:hypothetical protein